MSKVVNEVIAANKKYVSTFGAKKDLALPPARHFAIQTLSDPMAECPIPTWIGQCPHLSVC